MNKFEKVIHWIRSQVTLRRAWYLYFLSFSIFIIASIYWRDSYWFQLGVTLFSIAIVYLGMIESSKELRETTEKQVKAFVDNLKTVCTELKDVSGGISALANVMKEVREAILTSTLASQTAIVKAEAEKRKRNESIKPLLSTRVVQGGFQWWFIDTRHYHLLLDNSGSDAIQTMVIIGNWSHGPYNIGLGTPPIDIDIGHINDFRGTATLNILIRARDVDRNPYQSYVEVSLPQPQQIPVPLTEM